MKSVVAIVNYEDNILIGKKKSDSVKFLSGQWHIPGGDVKENESDEQALTREMLEEAGIIINVKRYIDSHETLTNKSEARWYECFYVKGKLRAGDDLEEVKWIPKNEVLNSCSDKAISLWSKEIKKYFNSS